MHLKKKRVGNLEKPARDAVASIAPIRFGKVKYNLNIPTPKNNLLEKS
jgi:hypothetical protein